MLDIFKRLEAILLFYLFRFEKYKYANTNQYILIFTNII